MLVIQSSPAADGAQPLVRNLREGVEPTADVSAALGVVCRRAQKSERPTSGAQRVRVMELRHGVTERTIRFPADFIPRH
jgi:hypothetical protein